MNGRKKVVVVVEEEEEEEAVEEKKEIKKETGKSASASSAADKKTVRVRWQTLMTKTGGSQWNALALAASGGGGRARGGFVRRRLRGDKPPLGLSALRTI
uniref:Uncharacterized protein n=1 Tax=Coccidioides posadasii RMSCC 3488 TaxID=454284 RepID=A0A0J6ETX1_COCPO|nr:hypothetical protein CPAG_00333 [Coccidioides posadasii RMSCC 3488]